MTDPRRPESPLPGSAVGDPQDQHYVDPAYAEQAAYGQTYAGPPPQWAPNSNASNPTLELPAYWQEEQALSGGLPRDSLASPPPEGPKSPRWLWFLAGAAVMLVVGLVIALLFANGAVRTQTAVPPLPMPESGSTTPSRTPAPSTSRHPRPALPPGLPSAPTESTDPATLQDVVYNVTGDGRAISITYLDTGGVMQTEFNVALPWSKEVRLSKSAVHPPIVTVINIGHNVTCSLTVAGVKERERVGVGLTICNIPPN